MLQSANLSYGCSLRASDGAIGEVSEFLFNDRLWTLRYLVAQIGGWLDARFVLIPAGMLVGLDRTARTLEVALTQQQVADSPDISIDQPVSHQLAGNRVPVGSMPAYWSMAGLWGLGVGPGDPRTVAHVLDMASRQPSAAKRGDPHLRSTRAMRGYSVQSSNGPLGHIADFIIDDTIWAIRYIVIAPRTWWPGKKVIAPARWLGAIDSSQSRVMINAPREVVQSGPIFDPAALAHPLYEPWLRNAYAQMQEPGSVISA